MSILASQFRASVAKSKDYRMKNEEEFPVGYSTGFLSFDFRNGMIIHVKTEDKDFSYYSVGVTDGSFIMLIGRSGCGKSTWLIQTAANIIRPFTTSCAFIDSIEGGMTVPRREQLTDMYGDELTQKFIVRNTGITIENFYERIKMIYDLKMENRAAFEYDTQLYDTHGNRVYKLEPTVYGLDSVALIMSDKYADEEELSGQMAATATAKSNSAVFKRIIPMLKSANIILFAVNHITEAISINPMQKKKSQVSYLKPDERLPGGNAIVYLANNIIRFDDVTKLKSDATFGIDGSLVDLMLVKSRTNKAGQSCTLVFNQSGGFDQDLSLFLLLKQADRINGAGAYFYIGEHSEMKFSQKSFTEKLKDPAFRAIFMDEVISVLTSQLIAQESTTYHDHDLSIDIMNRINAAA